MPPWEKYQKQDGPWAKYQAPAPEEQGFADRVGERLSERVQKMEGVIGRKYDEGGLGQVLFQAPELVAQGMGQAAGGVLDIAGEGIRSGYETVVPERAQQAVSGGIKNILETDIGQKGLQALSRGQQVYRAFKEQYPDSAQALEGALNIAGVSLAKKATDPLTKEVSNIGKDVSTVVTKATRTPKAIDWQIYKTVKDNIGKAIRPTVVGKRTNQQIRNYYKQAQEAVETIIDNKNSLRLVDDAGQATKGLPQNLSQFSQAIEQTKRNVFKQYDELARQSGATVDLTPIARQLKMFSASKPIQTIKPEVARYADNLAEQLLNTKNLSATEVQDTIRLLNESLSSFYKNPSYDAATRAYVDSLVANNLRRKLDKVITKTTGKEYQALKKKYGALKAIEKEVTHRFNVDFRKNVKGLVDFSDIFSGAQAVNAITSQNAALFASAATAKGIARYYKKLVDPNRMIKRMFVDVEKTMQKRAALGKAPEWQSDIAQGLQDVADLPQNMRRLKKLKQQGGQFDTGDKFRPRGRNVVKREQTIPEKGQWQNK